jgi:hypothetical protein
VAVRQVKDEAEQVAVAVVLQARGVAAVVVADAVAVRRSLSMKRRSSHDRICPV